MVQRGTYEASPPAIPPLSPLLLVPGKSCRAGSPTQPHRKVRGNRRSSEVLPRRYSACQITIDYPPAWTPPRQVRLPYSQYKSNSTRRSSLYTVVVMTHYVIADDLGGVLYCSSKFCAPRPPIGDFLCARRCDQHRLFTSPHGHLCLRYVQKSTQPTAACVTFLCGLWHRLRREALAPALRDPVHG